MKHLVIALSLVPLGANAQPDDAKTRSIKVPRQHHVEGDGNACMSSFRQGSRVGVQSNCRVQVTLVFCDPALSAPGQVHACQGPDATWMGASGQVQLSPAEKHLFPANSGKGTLWATCLKPYVLERPIYFENRIHVICAKATDKAG